MNIASSPREIAALIRPLVLVPTMGALHEGHAALIRQGAALARARGHAGGCVVTIFVNPTQFNDPADFDRYPRTLEADAALCRDAGAAAIVSPDVSTVYTPGLRTPVPVLPDVATRPRLEDAHRPGHFDGVCQVVARLFELVQPIAAVFGEKDWQQLQVIRAMVRTLGLPIDIIPGPTVREPNGLALSSRNRFLAPDDRRRAIALHRALATAGGHADPDRAESAMTATLAAVGIVPDYAVVREASTLLRGPGALPPGTAYRALIAAPVGTVRLLDNAPWGG